MHIHCDFFRAHVMAQFHALAEYLRHTEAQLQESHHTIKAEILADRAPSGDAEAIDEWLSFRQQELDACDRRFSLEFRQTLRFAVVISTFTLVESNLSRVAKEIAQRKGLKLDMEDLQAKDLVRRFEKFWTKVAGLSWWSDPRWDALRDIEALRNCIAHRRGRLRENDGRIHQLISKKSGITVLGVNDPLVDPDDAGTVAIAETFCERAISEMAKLFTELFDRADCFGPDHVVLTP